MEPQQQSEQPIINPTLSPEEKRHKKTVALFLVFSSLILVFLIVGLLFASVLQRSDSQAEVVSSDSLQPIRPEITVGAISWKSMADATPLKIIPLQKYNAAVRVFNVGTVSEGAFAGQVISLAFPEYAGDIKTSNYGIGTYLYFISDMAGNPVAWDRNFQHDNSFCGEDCMEEHLNDSLGLSDALEQDLSGVLPPELSHARDIETANGLVSFSVDTDTLFTTELPPYTVSQGIETKSGFQIARKSEANVLYPALLPPFSYHLKLPFGKALRLTLEPDFNPQGVVWKNGDVEQSTYRYGQYAYGWEDCYNLTAEFLENSLIETGATLQGDSVFEIDPQKYADAYKCLHEKTRRYNYNADTDKGTYVDTVSLVDFIPSHPMFFWRSPFGEWMAFMRSDVVPPAEKAKPVVYLYPTKEEEVGVKVAPIGGFSKTDPDYGNGWVVRATPEGVITNLADGKRYPYLFWEGGKEGVVETPKQGFVVAKDAVAETLDEKLALFGLNEQERSDFLEFWVPKLSRAPYYFLTFISRSEIDRVSPMRVSPAPDSVIRVLLDYKPLLEPISVEPLPITPTERTGFTVVEWGGIVRD